MARLGERHEQCMDCRLKAEAGVKEYSEDREEDYSEGW